MIRPVDLVRKVAPHAKPEYLQAFDQGDAQFATAGVNTPLRLAHFLAQTAEETGGYSIFVENGNYTAVRMTQVWPHRFRSITDAAPYAHNPEKLFNLVYANRMGNGPPSSGDGFRYRGRGLIQTTGRSGYTQFGFEANPDAVCTAEHALTPALGEWTAGHCNEMADRNAIAEITRRINGGLNGFAERQRWFHLIYPLAK